MSSQKLHLSEIPHFAKALTATLTAGDSVYLQGELGAGKTALVRAMLQAWGYTGVVKSPTYSLMDVYELENNKVAHFDLYRLNHSEELVEAGLSEYLSPPYIALVEWPTKGGRILPKPTYIINIDFTDEADTRQITVARLIDSATIT